MALILFEAFEVMTIKTELEGIIESAVIAQGCELVGCEMIQSGNRTTLRVYVDAANGIGIDDITQVSRQISAVLDVEEPIPGRYRLEVSSPGLDRPLFQWQDYCRFVGKSIKLRLRVPQPGSKRRNYEGVLISAEDEQIILEFDSIDRVTIQYEEIEKANLIPEIK
jgi:ribosome maturation factor RimP